jgi:putative two-component system response regulator
MLRAGLEADLLVLVPDDGIAAYQEACRNIKFDQRTHRLSVIFLLSPAHLDRAADLFDCGADDCVSLQAQPREIQLRLRNAVRAKLATDSMENAETMILSLARAIEGKDVYTCGHVERVGTYSEQIGRKIGLDEFDLTALRTGGVVHDIGKVGIPDQILNKPGKLTDEEFAVIKRHPIIGHDILKPMRTFADVLPIVRWHHEKPNGKGYPDGLSGEEIPVLARIAAVADWFDALITDRPYRKAFELSESFRMLREGAERGELDPKLVEVLTQIVPGTQPVEAPSLALV